jgi:hypothetical protein
MSLIMPQGRPQPPVAAPGGSRSVSDAMGYLRGYAKTSYGKDLSDQDFQDYARRSGFQGDSVNDEQMRSATSAIDQAFGGQRPASANPEGSTPVPGPPPSGHPTPLPPAFSYQPQFNSQITGLMNGILANPGTMNQQWQDQQYEAGKETANDFRRQMGEQVRQGGAGRGWSGASGVQGAILGNLDENLVSQLLAGRRDISMRAAQGNRQDTYNAINAAQGLDQQGFGNALGAYGANLDAWRAGEGTRQFDANHGLQSWLASNNVRLEDLRFNEGKRQFNNGFGLDFLRFLENQRQFGQTFGEGQRQFNNTMGLNWFNAQGNQMNNQMGWFRDMGW